MSAQRGLERPAATSRSVMRKPQTWPDWLALLPLGLLVVSVLLVAGYTTLVHLRFSAIRATTVAVHVPALRAAQDLTLSLAVEVEGLYQHLLTGDTEALGDYERAVTARRNAAVALRSMAPHLGGESRERGEELLRLNARWDATAPDPETARGFRGAQEVEAARDSQRLYQDILRQATALQAALRRDIDVGIEQSAVVERLTWYFTLGLAGLALTASLLVLWLIKRVRRLARVSEARRVEAEAALEHRARLIRGVTHDVKNPLGAADGSAQLLEIGVVGQLTDAQREAVRRIRRGIGAALAIASDLLELGRAEGGQLEVDLSSTDVATILAEAEQDYRFQADAQQLRLAHEVPSELPRAVTDGEKVREIVGNLLSNAVKFTPSGGTVTIRAGTRAHGPMAGRWLAVSVRDTGPGIAPEEHEMIFEEFYRSRRLAARTTGVGLGLSISRRMARLLGGDLTVESELGRGSEFTLWLPLGPPAAGSRAA